MIGHGIEDQVLRLVEEWTPTEAYDRETEFQKELAEYLDQRLNEDSSTGVEQTKDHVVEREHGRVNGDVVVNDSIGIELKRDLSNSQTKKLDGQIRAYCKEYDFVIACACGIEDMSGWRRLKNDYQSQDIGTIQQDYTPVEFVHKKKEKFGNTTETNQSQSPSTSSEIRASDGQLVDEIDAEEIFQDGIKGVQELTTDKSTGMSKSDAVIAVLQLSVLIFMFVIVIVLVLSVLI